MKQKYIYRPLKVRLIVFLKNNLKITFLLAYLVAALLAYHHYTKLIALIPNARLLFGVTTREIMTMEFTIIAFILLLILVYIVITPVFSNWLFQKRFGPKVSINEKTPRLISKHYNLYVDHEIIYVLNNKNISTTDFAGRYFNDLETAFDARIRFINNYKNSLRKTEIRAIPFKHYNKSEEEPIFHPDSEDF